MSSVILIVIDSSENTHGILMEVVSSFDLIGGFEDEERGSYVNLGSR